ncbi:BTAD domain-containing putative transcriptional regulator [Actinophytocola sediminis]
MVGLVARLVRGVLAAAGLVALVVVLPWALARFVGWPLPDHLPSWAEIHGVLLGPMTTTFLLDVLACLIWVVWVFVIRDVARCAIEIARDARMPDLSAAGPVHRIAAVLVGSVLISILGQRTALSSVTSTAAGSGAGEAVAAAPAWRPTSEEDTFAGVHQPAYSTPYHQRVPAVAVEHAGRAKSAVVLPYDPDTGVHDSLWRMSERALGDGHRWPEIYALNQGKPQPNGGTFTHPDLIFPGEEMILPDNSTVGTTPPTAPGSPPVTPPPPPEPPPSSTTTPAPSATQPPATTEAPQPPPAPQTPPSTHAPHTPAVRLGEELFVGLGLAAAVSTALAVVRRRNRRHYRPGSGDRSDLPIAPAVYQLRLAHLRAQQNDPDTDDELDRDQPDEGQPRASAPPVVLGRHGNALDPAPVLPVGVRDDRVIAVDLAAAHGLGLLGVGAPAAVRALLVTVLHTGVPGTVIVPAEDVAALLGRRAAQAPFPVGLRVAAGLDAALDMLESETLVRVGQPPPTGQLWGPLVLVARTPGHQTRRLQAVLDNGSTIGVTGLLLGQWNPGVTAYVRDDGTISTTNPGLGEPLRGTHMFRLGDDHTADLLALLRHADPDNRSKPADTGGDELSPALVARSPIADFAGTTPGRATIAEEGWTEEPVTDTDLEILGSAPARSPGSRMRPARPAGTPKEQAVQTDENDQKHGATAISRPVGEDSHGAADAEVASFVPLRVTVLGPPRVWWRTAPALVGGEAADREITAAFQPRLRELLVFLALHPDGATREALIAALWATSPPEKTTNALNTSLSRLRRAMAAATENALSDVVLVDGGRYRLNPDLVDVDYHHFAAAVAARRTAATDLDRTEAYRHIVDSYTGPLADGLSTEWLETAREAIRRDAIDAVAALARTMIEHDPQHTLDLLEIARAFDPHNELIYRDIMRVQERLGQLDAIPRTLTLLTTRLAEIDDHPTQQAIYLADRLRRRHDTPDEPVQVDRELSRARAIPGTHKPT